VLISCDAKSGGVAAQTCNLSCSGLYGNVPIDIAPFSRVKVTMSLPVQEERVGCTGPVQLEGVVVRGEIGKEGPRERGYGIAIFFSNISEEARTRIATYVFKQLTRASAH
jgi:hypothetical protein